MARSLDREDLLGVLHAFRQSTFAQFQFALGSTRIAVDRRALRHGASSVADRESDRGMVDAGSGLATVGSPLLGVFEARLRPEASPLVERGSEVRPDTTIGAISVLGRRTDVKAGVGGTVVEVAVHDGAFVEYGQTLIRVRRGADGALAASVAE